MKTRIKTSGGDEYDAFSKRRRNYTFPRGYIKKLQRAYNKRLRKKTKVEQYED